MNRNKLKIYAPKARRDFIKAVTDRAAFYGLTKQKIEPVTVQGDVAIIGGKPFPRDVAKKRKWMEERISREGFEQVMEAMAYTWFNRFVAIRYMELHGYLDHGYRVLSHPEGKTVPEIVEHAEHVDFPGLDPEKVIELKLDGTKEAELYRILLIAQCNALHQAMPFLFEKIGGYTELLMPDNLLHSNSPIRNLVNEIPEEDWQEIEIIGWLYQFYISEKKDQVIGKVVKSEDIPAATQLFTPNWIVKYMVQNSLGAQWLATYPQSPLKEQMEYYIEPAEQTEEVKAQLAAITPNQLNPEELTLIDPACGSGHILVEAYELFKAIYLERGYRQRDVPRMILEKNLFGLDIDERAAQLSGFCLMMKGRADDRRLFERGVNLNVMALVDSAGFDAEGLAKGVELGDYGLKPGDLTELKRLFEHATTFGSLIQVPEGLAEKLPALKQLCETGSQDLFVSDAIERLGPLVQQAEMLGGKYDAVVANPPYMGSKYQGSILKAFSKEHFLIEKGDLFACFMRRSQDLALESGRTGLVTRDSWMFQPSYRRMRESLLRERPICVMAHFGAGAFGSISGEVVQTVAFVLGNTGPPDFRPIFDRLLEGGEREKRERLLAGMARFDATPQDQLARVPGSPIAYWVDERVRELFVSLPRIEQFGETRAGLQTDDNPRFLRFWFEVQHDSISFECESRDIAAASGSTWFLHMKGGSFRKWWGNREYVVNWRDDGRELFEFLGTKHGSATKRIQSLDKYFSAGITWSHTTTTLFSAREMTPGAIFNVEAPSLFGTRRDIFLPLLNSNASLYLLGLSNPGLHFVPSSVASLPFPETIIENHVTDLQTISEACIFREKTDWDSFERSWDFQSLPILTASSDPTPTLESSYTAWITQNRETIAEMKRLEEENNRLFIDAYGLQDELSPDVPIEQITLTVNPAYRYGGKLTEEEQWTRFRQDTMKELVSYAIGCMLGRYGLDESGLIYAHSGGEGFDTCKYTTFPADDDGIIPITDTDWFNDNACHRLIEFTSVAWDVERLEENLTFLAENLLPKKNETSRETIRRYLCEKFFKDHLQTYKKRPIYWLFSSGKLRAFQCLVYLHRYNEGTLARMRTEYGIPLQGKIAARIEQLSGDINAATSTAHSKKLEREKDKLVKQQAELQAFDEKLCHYADQRISLDLDDGVKVNYGKFGDLLAEVKAVTGKKPK